VDYVCIVYKWLPPYMFEIFVPVQHFRCGKLWDGKSTFTYIV